MPDYAVNTAFTAKDKITSAFNAMGKGAGRFDKKASAAFRHAGKEGSRFKSIVGGILTAGAVQKGIGVLTNGLRNVTGQFVEFDDSIIGAAARFKDIGPDAANFDQQLQMIKQSAREAGANTRFTAAQAAAGLDFLARAGFTSAEAMGSLNSMINLAVSTGEDFATVADYSSDLLGAFGLSANTTAQKIANLNRLNDVLVKSANSANVTVESMFETMKTAGPIARTLGYSLEQTAAATAILGNAGIKGTEAGTALKNAMLQLTNASVQKMLKANGIAIADSSGNMRDFSAILSDVGVKLRGMGTAKQAQILDQIFGKRAIAGAKNLIDNLSGLNEFETMLNNAAGTSERTAARLQQSLGNRLKALGSAAAEFGFKILDAFDKDGRKGIDGLTETIRNFDTKPIVEGLTTAWNAVKMLYTIVQPFLPILPYLVGWFVVFNGIMKGLAILKVVTGFIQFVAIVRQMSGVMGVLNAVMMMNPVGLIVAGVALLIVGLIYLQKRFGIFTKGLEAFKRGFKIVIDFVKLYFLKFASFYVNIWSKIITTILGAASKIGGALGLDTSGLDAISAKVEKFRDDLNAKASGVEAPNAKEAEARKVQVSGQINIAGAPPGSTVENKTKGAPDLYMQMMGANP